MTLSIDQSLDSPPPFVVHEDGFGEGGVLELHTRSVALTCMQRHLMRILLEQREADRTRPASVRGFVPSAYLLASLPWECRFPSNEHVKQLIRRMRRILRGTELSIQSAQGFGYRIVPERGLGTLS